MKFGQQTKPAMPADIKVPVPTRAVDYAPPQHREDPDRDTITQAVAVLDSLKSQLERLQNDNDALTVELKVAKIDRERLELALAETNNNLTVAYQIRDEAVREVEAFRVFFDNLGALFGSFHAGHSPPAPKPAPLPSVEEMRSAIKKQPDDIPAEE